MCSRVICVEKSAFASNGCGGRLMSLSIWNDDYLISYFMPLLGWRSMFNHGSHWCCQTKMGNRESPKASQFCCENKRTSHLTRGLKEFLKAIWPVFSGAYPSGWIYTPLSTTALSPLVDWPPAIPSRNRLALTAQCWKNGPGGHTSANVEMEIWGPTLELVTKHDRPWGSDSTIWNSACLWCILAIHQHV